MTSDYNFQKAREAWGDKVVAPTHHVFQEWLNNPLTKALKQSHKNEIEKLEARLAEAADPIVGTKTWFNEEGKIVQQELKRSEVYKDEPVVFNTISSLRHKKTVGPIESAMTGLSQTVMQPCAGRNCGSTNPNLHSAECFEDYEKSTGMNDFKPDWDTVKAFDDRYNDDTELLRKCLEALEYEAQRGNDDAYRELRDALKERLK